MIEFKKLTEALFSDKLFFDTTIIIGLVNTSYSVIKLLLAIIENYYVYIQLERRNVLLHRKFTKIDGERKKN